MKSQAMFFVLALLMMSCTTSPVGNEQQAAGNRFSGDWYGEFEDTKIVILEAEQKDSLIVSGFGFVMFQDRFLGKFFVTGRAARDRINLVLAFENGVDSADVSGVYESEALIDCRYSSNTLADRFLLVRTNQVD